MCLEQLGMKCGGTLRQRAERLWQIRGLQDFALQLFLEEPRNQELKAGKTKGKKQRLDESVKLVLARQEKKSRKTQGPLLPGLERKAGQKSLPKADGPKTARRERETEEKDEFHKL
jgi:hypothetical protein